MPQYPAYSLSGANQIPALALSVPSQYPVITLVDAAGVPVTIGDVADGEWSEMDLVDAIPDEEFVPEYMKDSRGIVHCRGKVTANAVSTAVFVFPAGFRPIGTGTTCYFHWNVSPHGCYVATASGVLTLQYDELVDLSVIHFATELI